MLALVVVFRNVRRDFGFGQSRILSSGPKQDGAEGETGDVFENVGVLERISYGFAPCKRGVAGDQNSRDGEGVEAFRTEAPDDDSAGVANIGLGDFLGGEGFGERDGAVEVVGVGCAEAGDGTASLGPGGCKLRVGVDDAADLRKFAVEIGVCV